MKPIFAIGLLCSLLGVSCVLPQRTKTFIPATNERDFCKTDRRFIYADAYDYCFRMPDLGWDQVIHTGHRDTAIPSVTSDDFFLRDGEQRTLLFTLYVGPTNDRVSKTFMDEQIVIAHQNPQYTVGYIIDADATRSNPELTRTIPAMLSGLFFFTPDGARQADEP